MAAYSSPKHALTLQIQAFFKLQKGHCKYKAYKNSLYLIKHEIGSLAIALFHLDFYFFQESKLFNKEVLFLFTKNILLSEFVKKQLDRELIISFSILN